MTKQWLSDFHHGRRGQSLTQPVERWCLWCRKDAAPRWAYCSDECRDKSLAEERRKRARTAA
jgi:predicted nucleic acid-binding Zn ribbon protein